jgi:YD repeat-containing protein
VRSPHRRALTRSGIGAIAASKSPDQITTRYRYDGFGRPRRETVAIPSLSDPRASQEFAVDTFYDSAGRLARIRYPRVEGRAPFEVRYDYSASAGTVLWRVRDGGGKTLWQAEDHNAWGDLAQEVYGNKLRVVRKHAELTNLLTGLKGAFVSNPFSEESSRDMVPGLPAEGPFV